MCPGIHVHNEVGIPGEERHLALRIAAIGAVRIGFDEFANGKTIRRFKKGDARVFAHMIELRRVF
jgi:hypothetical protein